MTRWLYVAIAATLLASAASYKIYVLDYDQLPERIATHWDIRGAPDQFTPKESAGFHFWLVPLMMAGFVVLTVALPWLSPKSFAIEPFLRPYGYMMCLVVLLMGFIHALLLTSTKVQGLDTGRWLMAGILIFFALLGNNMGQVRRNFWIGIRTPWTLANDNVWIKTHRMGAWIFVVSGLGGAIAILLGVPMAWVFPVFIATIFVPVLYSLLLYKQLEKQGKI